MNALKSISLWLAVIGAVFIFFIMTNVSAAPEQVDVVVIDDELPIEELRQFTYIIEQVREFYVEPIPDEELFEHAIRGMLAGLDPHSAYLDEDDFRDLRVSTSGEFGGLGLEVTMEDGFVKVISPIDETPAAAAGVKASDTIVRIDETPVKGMTLREAVDLMRGKKGSSVELTIVRDGERAPVIVDITRDTIKVKSVRHEMLEPHYAYLRISHFQDQTIKDLKSAIKDIQKEADDELFGVVLDLRNNPGGVLESAIEVSDVFLNADDLGFDKKIVYTQGRVDDAHMIELASTQDMLQDVPIAVLVNGGSASASEIVAGALQDHGRAMIIGQETFGKGSVQTVLPIQENNALKLTTALYYTPSGRSIQAEGIVPDIILEDITATRVAQADKYDVTREEDLSNHLENGDDHEPAEEASVLVLPSDDDESGELIDYPVHEALNILKSLHFVAVQNG